MCQFVYVFYFKCYRDKVLNSIVQFMYYFRHENVVDIIQIKKKLVKILFFMRRTRNSLIIVYFLLKSSNIFLK